MNPITSKKHLATTVDIDSLLQDSYLLVVELRHGTPVQGSDELKVRCVQQIEYVRQQLERAGLNQRSIEYISHAQCALLDETVLGFAKDDEHSKWADKPLQTSFFSRHQAGEFLYDDMHEVLREPAPDLNVLTVFQRVLMLGFQGRYKDPNDPEREQLLAALSARVQPLKPNPTISTQGVIGSRLTTLGWLQSPLVQTCVAGFLLAAVWFGLDHLLGGLIATLVPEQV